MRYRFKLSKIFADGYASFWDSFLCQYNTWHVTDVPADVWNDISAEDSRKITDWRAV